MTLGETIQYYRKRSGLSQEALAELVGVSRQAVSKWELDESAPEVAKLKALAGAFGITTDQLLSGEKPPEPQMPPQAAPGRGGDRLPGLWGKLARRYGWLAGVYVALSGLSTTLVGGIARFAFDRMFRVAVNDLFGFGGGWCFSAVDAAGNPVELPAEVVGQLTGSSFGQVTALSSMGQVFVTIATVIMVVGILITAAGVVLALYLRSKGRENQTGA